jgi:hypothetical protein
MGAHKMFARQFACSINAKRARRVVLVIWPIAEPILAEYVIRANVNEGRVQVAANKSKIAHRQGVDCERRLRLGFGAIHLRVRRCIHDDLRRRLAQQAGNRIGVGDVDFAARYSQDIARQYAAKRSPQLAGGAQNDGFHAAWCNVFGKKKKARANVRGLKQVARSLLPMII